jgi:hypothetical protein
MTRIITHALGGAILTALYIAIVVLFLNTLQQHLAYSRSVLIPIFMLLLFVFSAALTGIMVFGRPVLWYLDNKKKDALALLFWTIVFLLILVIIASVSLFLFVA